MKNRIFETDNGQKREWVIHIDGDAFFASCEVSRRPDLFGKPVVVGEERGIVTALTYEAKALGIKRGDPIFKIKKDYPKVIVLSSHFELYRKFAKNLAEIILPEVDGLEVYSIDECFATITGTCQNIEKKVTELKKVIQKKLGITYSFGVSYTKTLAKVASKLNKPNGLVFLMNEEAVKKALQDTKVENVWGIGYVTDKKLKRYEIQTAYEFIHADLRKILKNSFNQSIFFTYDELCGNKHFGVNEHNPHKKSIQSTRTFLSKTNESKILRGELSRNLEVACSELRKSGLYTKDVYFFLSPKDLRHMPVEKRFELPNYTNSEVVISKFIERMFDEFEHTSTVVYKKSGVTLFNLVSKDEIPEDLFNENGLCIKEESRITMTIDKLRNKYGFGIIGLATSIDTNLKRRIDYKARHKEDVYECGLPFPFLGITY